MQKSIKIRLLKSFSLLVVLPVLAIFTLLIVVFVFSTNQTIKTQGKAIVDEIEANVINQFARYSYLLAFIERDQAIVATAAYPDEWAIPPQVHNSLLTLLQGYATSADGVDHLALLFDNGTFLCTDETMIHPTPDQTQSWYDQCKANPNQTFYFSYPIGKNPMLVDTAHYTSSISICRAINDANGKPVGVANLTLRGETLGKLLTVAYSNQGGQSYLTTPDGSLVNSPLLLEDLIGINDRHYLVTRLKIENLPLTVINIMPTRPFFARQLNWFMIGIISAIAFMLIFFIHTRSMSRQFIQPIEQLRKLMLEAQHGNLHVSFNPGTDDEFNDLAESFNQMVANIDRLINQVYHEQSSKRKAEIAALQANIKPHFLYNTLETIHWMARRYGADDIVEAVNALSDLFRVGFSNNHVLGTVALEFTHIESYLKIQKLRYHDILDYELEVDPSVRELPIQKTILQPIVENALYHGIKESGRAGKIVITAKIESGDLMIAVRDNGVGMDPQTLAKLRRILDEGPETQEKHGLGLHNVQKRLALSYGPPYGLTIESWPNEGTLVRIRHPILSENQLDDQQSDQPLAGGEEA